MKRSFIFYILVFTLQCFANPIPSGSALSIVAPTTITIPGNYRLANDIVGTITIATDNVCFDLENKKITADFNGIEVNGQSEISIKNGIVENAPAIGLFVQDCVNVLITNMDLVANVTGICILTSTGIMIQESTCRNNTNIGIALDTSIDCVISQNKCFNNSNGIRLSNISSKNIITENIADSNSVDGISLDSTSTVNCIKDNITNFNGANGIENNGDPNSFFSNKAQQNSIANFAGTPGVPNSIIAIFDLTQDVFINTPTICCYVNLSVISSGL